MKNNRIQILFRRWLTSIDKVSLVLIFAIILIGILISIASTPAIALKLGLPPFAFFKQHIAIVIISIVAILVASSLQIKHIKKLFLLGYVVCICLIVLTLFFGADIKGAKRWITIFGFSLQPAEFIKPSITILSAWLISEQYRNKNFPGILLSSLAIFITISLLLAQPDLGMSFLIVSSWIGQLFISGVSLFTLSIFAILCIGALSSLYFIFPHFADRIDKFLTKSGDGNDIYQVTKSLEAFKNGGFFGKGPGEGVIKTLIPDSHSDFVFSVIGEEFGFFSCFVIICLFSAFIIRSLLKVMNSSDLFKFSATFGILFQMLIQILINISTSLNLIPTKGMTLPFISYGGSSFLASSISIGVILAITKKNSATIQRI